MTAAEIQQEVPIRVAASVVLLRDSPSGLEAWLQSRSQGMAFAAGMTVFPGGGMEDGDELISSSALDLAPIRYAFDCSDRLARGIVGAAVRETFEETGLLLTRPTANLSSPAVDDGRLQFQDMMTRHDLTPDVAALLPWAHWLTPPGKRRRYDTYFFVATPPPNSLVANLTTEATRAEWLSPAAALAEFDRGQRRMLMPTVSVLRGLLEHATVDDVMKVGCGVRVPLIRPSRLPDGRIVAATDTPVG